MIILQYHRDFFRLTAPRCPGMADGAVSLRKSHDIVILSFCDIVKGQAKCPTIPFHVEINFSSYTKCPVLSSYMSHVKINLISSESSVGD